MKISVTFGNTCVRKQNVRVTWLPAKEIHVCIMVVILALRARHDDENRENSTREQLGVREILASVWKTEDIALSR